MNRTKLLGKMLEIEKDVLGDIHFTAFKFSFYNFEQILGIPRDEYTQLLINMRQEGLINIELKNEKNFETAIVSATKKGADYLIESKANK